MRRIALLLALPLVQACPPGGTDADGDGVTADLDCDDHDDTVFPGAQEVCDGLDNDCNGAVPADELDADLDGFLRCDADCDDLDDAVYPGADELCDGLDNDCDGAVPEDEADADGDRFRVCEGDCDDDAATVHPSASEACDGLDNDCNGRVDGFDGVSCVVNIDGEAPFATPGAFNGGGIAADDGMIWIQEFPGHNGFDGVLHRVTREGLLDRDWTTGVIAGFKPWFSHEGTLLVVGNWMDFAADPQVLHCVVDELNADTGARVRTVLDEAGPGCSWLTSVTQAPDGGVIYGTQGTSGGVRRVRSDSTSERIAEGFGNNTYVAMQSDGTLLVGSGSVFGFVHDGTFQQMMRTTDETRVSSVVVMPDDKVLVSTIGTPYDCWSGTCLGVVRLFEADLRTDVVLFTTRGDGSAGGFNGLAYDAGTREVVLYANFNDLYRVGAY